MGASEGFKRVPLGFDMNDVTSYISDLSKKMAKMESDMAANNAAAEEAKKLANDADIRIKAAVAEKDVKIAELNEKLLNERRGIDTYKVQIEELQKKLSEKDKEIQDTTMVDISTDAKKSKIYNDVIDRAKIEAEKIISDARSEGEKIILLAEGEKIRIQQSSVELIETLKNEIQKINASCNKVFGASAFLGIVNAQNASVFDVALSAGDFGNNGVKDTSDYNSLNTNSANEDVSAYEANNFEWDGSVDFKEGLGIAPDADENDIIGSMSFGNPQDMGYGLIENSSTAAMDSLNIADFSGMDMSQNMNDAWTGFAEETVEGQDASSNDSDGLGIEWVGLQPDVSSPNIDENDEMSSIADDLFSITSDDMTTEIRENESSSLNEDNNMFSLNGFEEFLGMTANTDSDSDGLFGMGIEPSNKDDDGNISIEPLVSYLEQDNSSFYDESFNSELFAQTMPTNDISILNDGLNNDLFAGVNEEEKSIVLDPESETDDNPWAQLTKELEEMEKMGAFNDDSSISNDESEDDNDPFAVADSTTDLMWDMGIDTSIDDDDDEMSTTTSGFTF